MYGINDRSRRQCKHCMVLRKMGKKSIVKVEAGKRTRRGRGSPCVEGHMDSESFHLIMVFLIFESQVLALVMSRRHEVGAEGSYVLCHLWLSPELD